MSRLPPEIIENIITYIPLDNLRSLAASDLYPLNCIASHYLHTVEKKVALLIPFPTIMTGEPLDWVYHLNGYKGLSLHNITVSILPVYRLWANITVLRISKGDYIIECIDKMQFTTLGQQELWLRGDTFHRINGPAKTRWSKLDEIAYQSWYKDGVLTLACRRTDYSSDNLSSGMY